jgi:hypothetical protein
VHPYFLTLNSAIQQLQAPKEAYLNVDISEPGTYVQWNLDPPTFQSLITQANITIPIELDDIHTLNCFPSVPELSEYFIKTHWKMLLIGEEHAGMFLHQDILFTAAYQIQLIGEKKWHLCAQNQSHFLYHAGDLDMFLPDYTRYSLALRAECYEMIVSAGDLLYYPENYWHQTVNIHTPSIALSSSIITAATFVSLEDGLRKECGGAKRVFAASPAFCDRLQYCYQHWNRMYQQSDDVTISSMGSSLDVSYAGEY